MAAPSYGGPITFCTRPYRIPSVTSFVINYNKTHKSQLKYEIKYDLYKISRKNKKTQNLNFGFVRFFLVFFPKT